MKDSEKFAKILFFIILIGAFVFEGIWAVISFANVRSSFPEYRLDFKKEKTIKVEKDDLSAQKFVLFETNEILNEVKNLAQRPEQISVILVGDIMLSRTVNEKMKNYGNYFYPFEKTDYFLNGADITFGNLESPIYSGRRIPSGSFTFDADPRVAENLSKAGFDVLSLANNHAGNTGSDGFLKSFELLNENNIQYVGAEKNKQFLSNHKVITEANGIKIGWLAYAYGPGIYAVLENSPGMALMDVEKLKKDIAELKPKVDHVFVSMHAGAEYTENISNQQRSFARAAIDSGAGLVVGHHPHVVQRMEKYKQGYIFYSLGNFVFDQMWSENTRRGLAVRAILDKNKINEFQYFPVKIYDYAQPRFSQANDLENVYKRLHSDPVYGLAALVEDDRIIIAKSAGHIFEQRTEKNENFIISDMNKNKIDEYFYLRNNKVYLLEQKEIKWQSYPDWKVERIFSADANFDGKKELNLIFEKQSERYWFILGWEKDSWRQKWISSPIQSRIIDVAQIEPGKFLILEKTDQKKNLVIWQRHDSGFKLVDMKSDIQFFEINKAGDNLFLLK